MTYWIEQNINGEYLLGDQAGRFPKDDEWVSMLAGIVSQRDRIIEQYGSVDLYNVVKIEEYNNPPARPKIPTPKQTGHVYLLLSTSDGLVKIGMSTNVSERIKWLKKGLPFEVECLYQIPTNDIRGLEKKLHECFSEKRSHGEWFKLTPDDIKWIIETCPLTKEAW